MQELICMFLRDPRVRQDEQAVAPLWQDAKESFAVVIGVVCVVHLQEHVLKGCAYASVLATPDCKHLYATGSDKKIKEFEDVSVSGMHPCFQSYAIIMP